MESTQDSTDNLANSTVSSDRINGTEDLRFQYNATETVVVMIPMCIITSMVILGNLLVIVAVLKERHLRTPQNIYLLSLAFVDFLVGVFILPINMMNQLHGWRFPLGLTFCKAYTTTDFFLCATSIYHLLAVAEDRYRIVSQGIQYIHDRTLTDVLAKLLVVYTLSLWIGSAPLLGWGGGRWLKDFEKDRQCAMLEDPGFAFFASFGCFWFPAAMMLYFYLRIYQNISGKLRRRRPTVADLADAESQSGDVIETEPSSSGAGHNRIIKNGSMNSRKLPSINGQVKDFLAQKRKFSLSRERRTAKTLGIVMGAFVACWLPFTLMLNVYMICPHCPAIPPPAFECIVWLGYVNSALNPIIYTVFNAEFRQAFKKVLHI